MKTVEGYIAMVERNPYTFDCVPQHMQTRDMCLQAVKWQGRMLIYVAPRLRDLELCMAAAAQAHFPMNFVPERHREAVKAYLKLIGES